MASHQAIFSLYNAMSFFVVASTVKPFRVAPVELVDYLMEKLFTQPDALK